MSTPEAEFRQSLITAVQRELERHASAIVAQVERVRQEQHDQRVALEREVRDQLVALTKLVHQVQQEAEASGERTRAQFEARVLESEQRQTRRVDAVSHGIDELVQTAAKPVLQGYAADHQNMGDRVAALGEQLRKFDAQAARLVQFVSDQAAKVDARQQQQSAALTDDVAARLATLASLVDANEASVRKFQTDVGQSVTARMNDAEDRINSRLMASEARMKEDAGAKIADIQAHVGRVQANLDDTLTVVNQRLSNVDDRFAETGQQIAELREAVKGVDRTALDELSDKMSAAVGEAMLVRIDMERFQKDVNERADTLAVRLTEVETELQDATMDVSTAVQLDRLEEIERQLLELDPAKFVLRGTTSPVAPSAAPLGLPPLPAPRSAQSAAIPAPPVAAVAHSNGVKVEHGAA